MAKRHSHSKRHSKCVHATTAARVKKCRLHNVGSHPTSVHAPFKRKRR